MGLNRNFKESVKVARVKLGDATGIGGVLDVPNQLGRDVVITRLTLDVTSAADAGTPTGDFGVDADGATGDDTLLDGVALDATGLSSNLSAPGTNGVEQVVWGASQHVVGSASTDPAGLEGYAHIEYIEREH